MNNPEQIRRRLAPHKSICRRFKTPGSCSGMTWSADEKAILLRHAHQSLDAIQTNLQVAGFARSRKAIEQKRLALTGGLCYVREDREIFTCGELAAALGVDRTTVRRWIKLGYLAAQPGIIGDDKTEYHIKISSVRHFIIHCTRYVPRSVDIFWLVDVLCSRHGAKCE